MPDMDSWGGAQITYKSSAVRSEGPQPPMAPASNPGPQLGTNSAPHPQKQSVVASSCWDWYVVTAGRGGLLGTDRGGQSMGLNRQSGSVTRVGTAT